MDDRSYMHAVMPVIRWIDDLQEGRQRPVVFITADSVTDRLGQPRSSSQKTFRLLLESYNVFFVAPADFNNRLAMAETLTWLEQQFDAPTYNHVIFTNDKQLLIGDYLIDTAPDEQFMGTVIPIGSDAFKTWDEIAEYFSRLGGQ